MRISEKFWKEIWSIGDSYDDFYVKKNEDSTFDLSFYRKLFNWIRMSANLMCALWMHNCTQKTCIYFQIAIRIRWINISRTLSNYCTWNQTKNFFLMLLFGRFDENPDMYKPYRFLEIPFRKCVFAYRDFCLGSFRNKKRKVKIKWWKTTRKPYVTDTMIEYYLHRKTNNEPN